MSEPEPFPRVQGRCPVCRSQSLFLAEGGYVTCGWHTCPNPSYELRDKE